MTTDRGVRLVAAGLAALSLVGCAAQGNTSLLSQQLRLLARRQADSRADLDSLRLEVARLAGRVDRLDGGAYSRSTAPGEGAATDPYAAGSTQPGGASTYGQPAADGQAATGYGQPANGQAAPGYGSPAANGQAAPGYGQPAGNGQTAPGWAQGAAAGSAAGAWNAGQPSSSAQAAPAAAAPGAPVGFADLNQDLARGASDATFTGGLEALRRGDRDAAIQTLRDYAAKNRDNPLAPYAQFWVGEAQLSGGRYYEAILAYNDLATNWPKSDRVPAAKLRQAEAFAASGDPMDARLYLKELIEKYPGTPEAAEAERRLRSLGG